MRKNYAYKANMELDIIDNTYFYLWYYRTTADKRENTYMVSFRNLGNSIFYF